MEITKVNVPVKVLNPKCLKCPKFKIECREVNYGKEVKQYIYECANLSNCLFIGEFLKEEEAKE